MTIICLSEFLYGRNYATTEISWEFFYGKALKQSKDEE
jgi:hypothetical protein